MVAAILDLPEDGAALSSGLLKSNLNPPVFVTCSFGFSTGVKLPAMGAADETADPKANVESMELFGELVIGAPNAPEFALLGDTCPTDELVFNTSLELGEACELLV